VHLGENRLLKNSRFISLISLLLLGFLPPNLVTDGFSCLFSKCPTHSSEFFNYVLNTLIPDAVLPTILRANKPLKEPRTTNGPGAFYRHNDSQFCISHPSICQVVNILLDVQSETYLKMNSIKRNHFNKCRKERVDNLKFILKYLDKISK